MEAVVVGLFTNALFELTVTALADARGKFTASKAKKRLGSTSEAPPIQPLSDESCARNAPKSKTRTRTHHMPDKTSHMGDCGISASAHADWQRCAIPYTS